MFDWNVRFGDVLVIISFVAIVAVQIFRAGRVPLMMENMQQDLRDQKQSIQKISDTLVQVAVQKTRLDGQQEQMTILQRQIEDMRNGRGFIVN